VPDFYSVLQVQPNADQEIIEAAYRQLMKNHHPDVAGTDAELAAQHHERAKLINQAHSVLGDPVQRRRYDAMRSIGGGAPPRSQPWDAAQSHSSGVVYEAPFAESEAAQAPPAWTAPAWTAAAAHDLRTRGELRGPFSVLVAAYCLLPGPYEWEGDRGQDVLVTCLLPPVGVTAFALATGRLDPLLGHSPMATLVAWGVLILLTLPSWSALPRLAMASVPSIALMSGVGDLVVRQASVPNWLPWVVAGFFGVLLSARLYVFAVLPTLAACWVLSRLG